MDVIIYMNFQHTKFNLVRLFCIVLLISGMFSCSRGDKTSTVAADAFQLVLLRGMEPEGCDSLDLGSSWETAWPVLQGAYPANVIHRVNLNGIETYHWTEQKITLTVTESRDFLNVVTDKEYPGVVCSYAFITLLADEPIYGGRLFLPFSEMAAFYPVIYLEQGGERMSLSIRPFHFVRPIDPNDPAWQNIEDARIQEVLLQAGKLIR